MEFTWREVQRNNDLLKEIKNELNNTENRNFTFVGLDFVVEFNSSKKGHRYKCMLCKNHLGKSGVLKHLQSQQHLALFLSHCFPTIEKFLEKFSRHRWDETLKLISTSLINALTIEICREIGNHHMINEFYPLLAQRISDKEFNSPEMVKFVVEKMPHIYEADYPDTKRAIDEIVKKFIVKSKQILLLAGVESPTKNAKVQTDERKFQTSKSPSTAELERMKVAINISMELVKNGLQISPSQLEESVKSYYKYELQKSLSDGELEELEVLTIDDIKLLLDNYESLFVDEQNKLKNYLTMLKKIEDKSFLKLNLDASCAKMLSEIIEN